MPCTIVPHTILDNDYASVYRIELPEPLPGYREFLTPWLVTVKNSSEHINILIDPGPAFSIPHLVEQLKRLEISGLDWIFLTHIHIDHAGGTGALCKVFPSAKVLVHPKGYKHLASPGKLWQGSLDTLGTLARIYGTILPVPKHSLVDAASEAPSTGVISILDTPGHASHHLSYLLSAGDQKVLFSGEAAGVFFHTHKSKSLYMRPATPPRFFFDTSIRTLGLLESAGSTIVCCGHYGFCRDAATVINLHKGQLSEWKRIIHLCRQSQAAGILEKLLENDRLLQPFSEFDKSTQEREKYFLANSVRGYLESLT